MTEKTDEEKIEGVFKDLIAEEQDTSYYAVLVGIDPGKGQPPVFGFPQKEAESLGAIIQGINTRLRMIRKNGPKIIIQLEAR